MFGIMKRSAGWPAGWHTLCPHEHAFMWSFLDRQMGFLGPGHGMEYRYRSAIWASAWLRRGKATEWACGHAVPFIFLLSAQGFSGWMAL